ncbi:MAG: hypothetical protein KC777_17365, partial [Cyanobacteria bacterium HKST-UBA02]|nr:hypothetical protein [Cyanobacteria bacterium HKST-UBA02]
MEQNQITEQIARRVLSVVDQGLTSGLGRPEAGRMCVEAAVCFALGEPHGQKPTCVASILGRFMIFLNDARWSSEASRAKGMRRIAIAQLGTAGTLGEREFAEKLCRLAITRLLPRVLSNAADISRDPYRSILAEAATGCRMEGAAYARSGPLARAAAEAARAAAYEALREGGEQGELSYAIADVVSAVAHAVLDAFDAADSVYAIGKALSKAAACLSAEADDILSDFAETVV